MSKLIIAEKPSVAKSIASALGASSRADGFYEGNGLLVSWCVGHLVSPMDAGGYDERFKKWRYDDLPILPEPFRYVLAPGKEDAFENLRALMDRSDVDTIVNACDAGREGELIFRLVYEMAGCRKPILRLWISSMEDSAIREGFSDLRLGTDYEALYQSALCRQKADWLVGINATRLFSVLYHRTLNVGRVQTPTLAMLAERDAKITLFHKEKYHLLRLMLDGAEAVSEKFTDSAEAEQAAAACKGAAVTCTSVKKEQKKEQPPKLYDLTTLQREANRLFGYTAKQTLDYAQSLYEKKLLTGISKVSITPYMEHIFAELQDFTHYRGGLGYLFLESKIHELLSVYLSEVLELRILSPEYCCISKSERDCIIEAKRIIDSELAFAPSCEGLARQVQISVSKLSRGFSMMYGISVHAYVIEQRLERAAGLLLESNMNIGQIAVLVGYTKPSNFSAAFKKKYGVMPKDYREASRIK